MDKNRKLARENCILTHLKLTLLRLNISSAVLRKFKSGVNSEKWVKMEKYSLWDYFQLQIKCHV